MIEVVNQMKLLGVMISSDMTWKSNTQHITNKGFSRMWLIRRLKQLGANKNELLDVYFKQIRSILEFAVPVWAGSITQEETKQIERVQKTLCAIILGPNYHTYEEALIELKLERLSERRKQQTLKFAQKSNFKL